MAFMSLVLGLCLIAIMLLSSSKSAEIVDRVKGGESVGKLASVPRIPLSTTFGAQSISGTMVGRAGFEPATTCVSWMAVRQVS